MDLLHEGAGHHRYAVEMVIHRALVGTSDLSPDLSSSPCLLCRDRWFPCRGTCLCLCPYLGLGLGLGPSLDHHVLDHGRVRPSGILTSASRHIFVIFHSCHRHISPGLCHLDANREAVGT